MDLYQIAFICLVSSVVSMLVTALMLWVDSLRDTRARERREREALAAFNKEVSRRPRVPAPSPLPTIERFQ